MIGNVIVIVIVIGNVIVIVFVFVQLIIIQVNWQDGPTSRVN